MAKLKLIETIQTKLPTLSKTDGQLIVIKDNASLYVDLDGARIYISDWIDVSTDIDRLAMLTPLSNKYYYVVETNKIWRYIGGSWIQITLHNASEVLYDNTTSGLSATNVNSAIDEISSSIDDLEQKLDEDFQEINNSVTEVKEDIVNLRDSFCIPESTKKILNGSYEGLLKISEIGGKTEQTTSPNSVQLLNIEGHYISYIPEDTLLTMDEEQITITAGEGAVEQGSYSAAIGFYTIPGKYYTISLEGATKKGFVRISHEYDYPLPEEANGQWVINLGFIAPNATDEELVEYEEQMPGIPIGRNSVTICARDFGVTCIILGDVPQADTPVQAGDSVTFNKLMVNEGETALPWEQYMDIPIPSPDNTQEVKKTVVTGIRTYHGKNMIKKDDLVAEYDSRYFDHISNVEKPLAIQGGKEYTLSFSTIMEEIQLAEFDDNQNMLDYHTVNNNSYLTFTSSLETTLCAFIGIIGSDYTLTIDDINVQFEEGNVASEYCPHQESSITFSNPISLYGNADVYDSFNSEGIIRKYTKYIFAGEEEVSKHSSDGTFFISVPNVVVVRPSSADNIWCNKLKRYPSAFLEWNSALGFSSLSDIKDVRHSILVRFPSTYGYSLSNNEDVQALLKEWYDAGDPMYIVHEMASPILEPLPIEDQKALNSLKSYNGITHVSIVYEEVEPICKIEYPNNKENSYILDSLAQIDKTTINAHEEVLNLEEKFRITETTDTTLEDSYPGLLKVNEIGGKMERFSTTGAQLLDSNVDDMSCHPDDTLVSIIDDKITITAGENAVDYGQCLVMAQFKTIPGNKYTISLENATKKGVISINHIYDYPLPEEANGKEDHVLGAIMPNATDEEFSAIKEQLSGVPIGRNSVTIQAREGNGYGVTYINLSDMTQSEISPQVGDSFTFTKLMVNEGETALPWEPYTDGLPVPRPDSTQEIKHTSFRRIYTRNTKANRTNYLQCTELVEQTINGVTFTPVYDSNGLLLRVDVKGENDGSGNSIYVLKNFSSETYSDGYILSGTSGGSMSTYIMEMTGSSIDDERWWIQNYDGNTDIPLNNSTLYSLYICVMENTVIDTSFYPSIRKKEQGDYTDEESYVDCTVTLSQPIDLYGTDDVQDVVTENGIERKYYSVKASVLSGYDDSYMIGYISLPKNTAVLTDWGMPYHNAMSNMFSSIKPFISLNDNKDIEGLAIMTAQDGNQKVIFRITSIEQTEEAYNAFLANTPIEVVLERAIPTIESLPLVDQIALNSLQTYNNSTYVEFEGEVQPTFKGEYGKSKETGYILESLLNTKTNKLNQELINNRIAALEATIVNNI